jgi:hypothetical protein
MMNKPPLAADADPEYRSRLDAERATAQFRAPLTRDELRARGKLRRRAEEPDAGTLFPEPRQGGLFE